MKRLLVSLALVLTLSSSAFALDLTSMAVGMMLADDGNKSVAPAFYAMKDHADGYLTVRPGSDGKIYARVKQTGKEWDYVTFEEYVERVRPDSNYVGFVLLDGYTYLLIKKKSP